MILTPAEKIAEYEAKGYWGRTTLFDLFEANCRENPDGLAVADPLNRFDIDGQKPVRLTYGELSVRVDAFAAALSGAGLQAGDILAVQLPNTVDLVVTYLAAFRQGLIVTPVPCQWREHELADILDFVDAGLIVTTSQIRGHDHHRMMTDLATRAARRRPVLLAGQIDLQSSAPARPSVDANSIATICWTSGTEARPKGVPRSHNHWIGAGEACVDASAVQAGDTILTPFPLINMAGLGGTFVPWLQTGGALILHHPFDLPTFIAQMAREPVAYTVAPPAVLTMLLKNEEALRALRLERLRSLGSGSAPLAPWMVKAYQDRFGLSIINIFGSNEGTCLISGVADVPDPEERAQFFPRFGVKDFEWPARIASRIETRLIDRATGAEITRPGEPGELLIKGPVVFDGYFREGEIGAPQGRAIDEDGYFHTGDVFEIAGPENRYYRFVDRAKDIIIRGGMNISPGEIDGLMAGHPAVAEAAVVGIADPVMGERICAVVVPKPGSRITLDDLLSFLRDQNIAAYKLPESLVIAEALPRNPVGKVLRRNLRDLVKPE